MRIYVASGLENIDNATEMMDILRSAGHIITFDWTKLGKIVDIEVARRESHRELEGVETADAVVVVLPGGRGTHTEMGIACAHRKPVILFYVDDSKVRLDGRPCAFYYLSNVIHVRSPEEVLEALDNLPQGD